MGDSTAAATTGASASVIRITHLFVPQQSGTSDSCESSEDSDVQVVCDCGFTPDSYSDRNNRTSLLLCMRASVVVAVLFQVLDFALSSGLICVGWIHTHPSQSCFLSSIDLHTSLGYQVLCNEALAIVVAPTDHQYQPCGVFRLTEYGIAYLKTCHRRGFHKHSDAQMPLYEVVGSREWTLVSDAGVTIVDRRIG